MRRSAARLLVLFSVLLGFGLRVYGLAAQSLWNDEGTSVALAQLSLPAIASGAAHDIHPPLYYFLLHFWMPLVGDTEFGVRFLSVVAGVLLIAVTARLAQDLFGPLAAGLAALLSALSAFQVYYSQETRMYIWVALFGALSSLALFRFLAHTLADRQAEGRPCRYLLLCVLFSVAALYTHYFAPALFLAQGLAVVASLAIDWRASGRLRIAQIVPLVAAWGVIAAAFLPWLLFAGNQLASWPAISQRLSLTDLTTRVLAAFVLGIDSPRADQWPIVALFALLFLLGLLLAARPFRRGPRGLYLAAPSSRRVLGVVFCALWALVPLAFMYVVSFQRPAYNPKFLLLATPGFILLAVEGIAALTPAVRPPIGRLLVRGAPFLAACALAVAGGWLAVQGIYGDPRLQRDDYRGVIGYINASATAEDAVLVDAPGQIDVFRYYYRGPAEVFALPVGRPMNVEATDRELGALEGQAGNVFGVLWATEQADPEGHIERTLGATRAKALDEWHGNIRLVQYGGPEGADVSLLRAPADFGGELRLSAAAQTSPAPVRAGQVLSLRLEWSALQHPSGNYKVSAQLLDPASQIVSQRDSEPMDGFRPTGSWQPGETIEDRVGLLIRPGTPPGDYRLIVGVYRPENMTRLPVSDGRDHLDLGMVHVAP